MTARSYNAEISQWRILPAADISVCEAKTEN
jgi:hypothetical protein